jgi:L,D-transpeptidase-like protein
MARFRFVAALLLAGALACSASKPTLAGILIQIDKRAQIMTVAVDGEVRYRWRVSTGATGYSTPVGSYTPFRMEVMHYSRSGTTPACPTRFSSPREGTASMARTIPALARRCHTVASVSRCRTPPRSISSSRRTAWGKPRSSSEGLIHRASRSRASRRDSGHGAGNHFAFSSSSAIPLAGSLPSRREEINCGNGAGRSD